MSKRPRTLLAARKEIERLQVKVDLAEVALLSHIEDVLCLSAPERLALQGFEMPQLDPVLRTVELFRSTVVHTEVK